MTAKRATTRDDRWERQSADWRDPAQVISQWRGAAEVDPALFRYRTRGRWWEAVAATGGSLLVTREYEHLVMALWYLGRHGLGS